MSLNAVKSVTDEASYAAEEDDDFAQANVIVDAGQGVILLSFVLSPFIDYISYAHESTSKGRDKILLHARLCVQELYCFPHAIQLCKRSSLIDETHKTYRL